MYERHWQLNERPFETAAATRFYYPCEAHQGALLKLRYVVENGRGAAALTGTAGLGKTLLVHALMNQLNERFMPRLHLVFPQMPPDQLLAYLADELTDQRIGSSDTSIDESIHRIRSKLIENSRAGRHAVIVIDEAQLLPGAGALETLRLLLNFETDSHPDLTLLLVGQTSLLPALDRMPSLEERLSVKCLLRPLRPEETAEYIHHRLTAAGAQQTIFEPSAMEAIHHLSHGVPRQINRLADLALLIGYAEEQSTLRAAQIESVSEELVTVAPE